MSQEINEPMSQGIAFLLSIIIIPKSPNLNVFWRRTLNFGLDSVIVR